MRGGAGEGFECARGGGSGKTSAGAGREQVRFIKFLPVRVGTVEVFVECGGSGHKFQPAQDCSLYNICHAFQLSSNTLMTLVFCRRR